MAGPVKASPQSGGALQVFAGVGDGSPLFLGWGQRPANPKFDPKYFVLKNDARGAASEAPPFDLGYVGQEGRVEAATFTVWNEDVLLAMMAFGNSTPGIDQAVNSGRLMVFEGGTYPLYFRNPRATTSRYMKNAGMPPGWRYLAAVTGPVLRVPGTEPNMIIVTWRCLGYPINVSAAGIDWGVWDENLSALAGSVVNLNMPV